MHSHLPTPDAFARGRFLLAAAAAITILPAMIGCDRLFYYPSREIFDDPSQQRLAFESVRFPARNGLSLHGWFFPAAGPGGPAKGTIVHFHGNAGNVTSHYPHVAWLPERGWNVFCFDYRGYGRSEGKPSRRGVIDDAHAAVDHVMSRPDVERDKVIAFGQSLGGAVGVVVAAERKDLCGVVVEGAFTSYREIAWYHVHRSFWMTLVGWWVPAFGMSGAWNPIDHVAAVSPAPLLIVQGKDDHIIDWRMAERLHAAARPPAWVMVLEDSRHSDAFHELAPHRQDALDEFLTRCVERRLDEGSVQAIVRKATHNSE
jgi:fermentation-respiration switch protein FrsA (DUF1100 family)